MKNKGFMAGKGGRLVALLVFLACGAGLFLNHYDDIFPPPPPPVDPNDPKQICLAKEFPVIEKMLSEGVIDEEKAALFKERAAARCEALSGSQVQP